MNDNIILEYINFIYFPIKYLHMCFLFNIKKKKKQFWYIWNEYHKKK